MEKIDTAQYPDSSFAILFWLKTPGIDILLDDVANINFNLTFCVLE